MGYDVERWKNRMSQRSDMTGFLTHLTRAALDTNGKVTMDTTDVLLKILREQKINGSTTASGFIVGPDKAVCFQDAPLYGITQNVLHEQTQRKDLGGKIRYRASGLLFTKLDLFRAGARPVIYEKTEVAKEFLHKDEWYKIVNLDFSDNEKIIDWTHEREWRIKGDFYFNLSQATVLLPNKIAYKKFVENTDDTILSEIAGIVTMNNIIY